MTVKLALIHPACEHCTIAEAAAGGKLMDKNHATSLTSGIKAPIYWGSVGSLAWQKVQSEGQRSLHA